MIGEFVPQNDIKKSIKFVIFFRRKSSVITELWCIGLIEYTTTSQSLGCGGPYTFQAPLDRMASCQRKKNYSQDCYVC